MSSRKFTSEDVIEAVIGSGGLYANATEVSKTPEEGSIALPLASATVNVAELLLILGSIGDKTWRSGSGLEL